MHPVTLVATDLDGTLLNKEKKVSPATRKAIEQLKEHGILFGVVSGRPVESSKILARDWGLEDSISFLIGMNGGVMYDMRREEKEVFSTMDGKLIAQVIDAYKDMPQLHAEVMVGNKRYVAWSTPETIANAKLFGEEEIIVDLDNFLANNRVNKLILRSLPEEQPAVDKIAKSLQIPGVIGFPTSDVLYEFVDPAVNKGEGLEKVCQHFGLSLDHVVAFGDESNDLEMLKKAGVGVAMKNATPPVKAIANVISEYTNDEDALAHFIEEEILPNHPDKLERELHG